MSECHDVYDNADFPMEARDDVDGAQCHDLYGNASAESSPVTAPSAAVPVHQCRIVDTQRGRVRVVRVVGRLDWSTEGDFRDFMCDQCASLAVVVDLSGADEDAAGTGVLLAATVKARKRGQQLVFVVPDDLEREVLLSTRLNEVAPLVRTEDEALAWFAAHGSNGVAAARSGVVAPTAAETAPRRLGDASPLFKPQTPRTMQAAVIRTFGAPLELEERPVPVPGRQEVLVKVEACGLCHTDIHAARGDWPQLPKLPLIPGHEAVGKVVEIGEGVSWVRPGDRVAVPWLGYACGRCDYCLSGAESLCPLRKNTGYDIDGAFAEYVVAAADYVVKVPAGVEPEDAACLSCAGVSAYRAVLTSGAGPGDLTAVFGVGGLGHLAVQYAHLVGASVVAVDTKEAKLTMASDLGAFHQVNASRVDPVEVIRAMGGCNQAIVAAASRPAADQALACLKPGGTLILLAIPADNTFCLPISETVHAGITIRGSIGGSRADLARVFALHAAGRTQVIHQARRLAQVNQAIAEVAEDHVQARLVFEFR